MRGRAAGPGPSCRRAHAPRRWPPPTAATHRGLARGGVHGAHHCIANDLVHARNGLHAGAQQALHEGPRSLDALRHLRGVGHLGVEELGKGRGRRGGGRRGARGGGGRGGPHKGQAQRALAGLDPANGLLVRQPRLQRHAIDGSEHVVHLDAAARRLAAGRRGGDGAAVRQHQAHGAVLHEHVKLLQRRGLSRRRGLHCCRSARQQQSSAGSEVRRKKSERRSTPPCPLLLAGFRGPCTKHNTSLVTYFTFLMSA